MSWLLLGGCAASEPELATVPPVAEPVCPQGETMCEDEVCWVRMCGGSFEMGDWHGGGEEDELPLHEVEVGPFDLLRTEVLVETWDRCVLDGACEDVVARGVPSFCRDRAPDDPRGCLTRQDADDVCAWLGGRVASEAEWEYAARSGGQPRVFPWGDTPEPDCELAVLGYVPNDPCGEEGPGTACSRPLGNTEDGVCDMAGNLYEWVADAYHGSYVDAPVDGSTWTVPTSIYGVLRGGGLNSGEPVTTTNRVFHEPAFSYSGSGTRCVRSVPEGARR